MLLQTISKNYDDWNTDEIFPEKKGGILKLNNEAMKEASKDIKEKGIKTSHLKELSERGVKFPDDKHVSLSQSMLLAPQKVTKR